jgi:hypothetical protein
MDNETREKVTAQVLNDLKKATPQEQVSRAFVLNILHESFIFRVQ